MSLYDAVVVGRGGAGSAALYHLARRGLKVIGLEARGLGHARGSSHGETRVIRKAYSEDPRYVPLLERSYELWRELETELAETLLWITGALHIGAPDAPELAAIGEAVAQHDLAHERLSAAEIHRRFPGLTPEPDDIGILEPEGGFLAVERCVLGHLEAAAARGAELRAFEPATRIAEDGAGVVVETGSGRYRAAAVVLCLGAWAAPGPGAPLAVSWPLEVTRELQCWFAPLDPELFELGRFPVFIRSGSGGEPTVYGLPRWRHPGVKICRHHGGERTDVTAIDRTVRELDAAPVRSAVSRTLPRAAGPVVDARVCMYTSTPDQHFAIGPHPRHARVWVAAGFSGHGFKLSSVVGELLAELVISGRTSSDIGLFDPGRFT